MKTTKTYSIEENVYRAFDSITTEKNINKSSFIEDSIKKFLKDNDMDFIDKLYSLRADPSRVVTVISQDSTYYILDDGSKIQKILFMLIFKECEPINPNEFFSKTNTILEKIVEKIKNIDPDINIYENKYGIIHAKMQEDVNLLNKINDNFKSGKYLTSDIKEIYYDLEKLKDFIFSIEKDYDLQQQLIKVLTIYKNDWIEANLPSGGSKLKINEDIYF